MKVKIIETTSVYALELNVNEFLSSLKDSDIIDIKYSVGGAVETYGARHFSAMIVFK